MVSNVDKNFVALAGYYECAGQPENPKWLNAYLDSGGVWTIGIGTIQYPNGQRVKKGDTITPQQRDEYFLYEVRNKVERVNFFTRDDISQQQFNAVVDLAYNIDTSALQKSTLLKVLNNNLTDAALINKFLGWRYDNGKEISGLLRRRMSDAYHYFTGKLKYDWINYKVNSPTYNISKALTEVTAEIKKDSQC